MGFIITTPTAVPVNLDGSHLSATWAESAGPFATPTMLATGYANLDIPAASDWNYVWQLDARWTRALRDRTVFSDEGLFTTCILSQGTWNIAGGTLDVTLTPTRIVVDVNSDGGTIIEIKAPAGSPETLAANTDTYVDLDEAGGYTLAAVPNGNPAPAVTAGHARIYKLVTDATELASVGLAQGVASFPCLGPITGVSDLVVGGTVTVFGDTTFEGEVNTESPVNVNSEFFVASSGDVLVNSKSRFAASSYQWTHATASDWRDSCRPSSRTFVLAGTVAGGGETVKTPITATTGSELLFSINDLTPSTNSAFVAFDVTLVIVWSNDANPPTGGAGLKTSVTWTAVVAYDAGTWSSTTNGAQTIVGSALGGSAVSLELDTGQIVVQVVHDVGVENRGYRWFAEIRGRVMQLAT